MNKQGLRTRRGTDLKSGAPPFVSSVCGCLLGSATPRGGLDPHPPDPRAMPMTVRGSHGLVYVSGGDRCFSEGEAHSLANGKGRGERCV